MFGDHSTHRSIKRTDLDQEQEEAPHPHAAVARREQKTHTKKGFISAMRHSLLLLAVAVAVL